MKRNRSVLPQETALALSLLPNPPRGCLCLEILSSETASAWLCCQLVVKTHCALCWQRLAEEPKACVLHTAPAGRGTNVGRGNVDHQCEQPASLLHLRMLSCQSLVLTTPHFFYCLYPQTWNDGITVDVKEWVSFMPYQNKTKNSSRYWQHEHTKHHAHVRAAPRPSWPQGAAWHELLGPRDAWRAVSLLLRIKEWNQLAKHSECQEGMPGTRRYQRSGMVRSTAAACPEQMCVNSPFSFYDLKKKKVVIYIIL